MTIYAVPVKIDGDLTTIIAAADSTKEFKHWWDTEEINPDNARESDLYEHMVYEELKPFKRSVFLFTHKTQAEQDEFLERVEIESVGPHTASDRQNDMILEETWEEEQKAEKEDRRTIGETTGTAEEDKWDKGVSKHDMNVMKGAPKGVTDDTSLGEGTLKKTIEDAADTKEKKILEDGNNEFTNIIYKVANGDIAPDDVKALADKLVGQNELDTVVADLVKQKLAVTQGDDAKVASKADLDEIEKDFSKLNEIALAEDDPAVGIMDQYEDADGNIQINAKIYSDDDKKQIRKMRKDAADKDDAEKEAIRKAAAAVGLDADAENTVTGLQDDGTVIQRNDRLGIQTTIASDGTTTVQDVATGEELDEKGIRKKELEAELKDLSDDVVTEDENLAPEKAKEQTEEEKFEDPTQYVFAACQGDEEASQPDTCVIFQKDYWEANKCWDESGKVPEWLTAMGFYELTKACYEHSSADLDGARQALLFKGVEELPELLIDEEAIKDYPYNANAIGPHAKKKTKVEEEKIKPEDYYYAICPPGFMDTDETAAIIGHETYIVTMPKAKFDEGIKPQDEGNWFTEEELDKFEWDEISNSLYVTDMCVGDAHRALQQSGAKEDGRLLYEMGMNPDTVPMDWPYRYKRNGHRQTNHDLFLDSIRVLEAAKEAGIILNDEDGDLNMNTAGVDLEAIKPKQVDITDSLKKQVGASGKIEDDIQNILLEAVSKCKEKMEESKVSIDSLQLSDDIKTILSS